MTIIRRKVKRNFTVISNDCANDPSLGGEELGLLYYLLSRPNNWSVKLAQLKKRMHWGRDKTYAVLNSLADKGYIYRAQGRNRVTGSFERVEYVVYDEPIVSPRPEKPEAEFSPRPASPLPANPKAAKRRSTESKQEIFPLPLRGPVVEKPLEGSADEEKRRSSSAAPPFAAAATNRDKQPYVWRQRGGFETQIVERLGPDGMEILSSLTEPELISLCRRQQDGRLHDDELAQLRVRYLEMNAKRDAGQ